MTDSFPDLSLLHSLAIPALIPLPQVGDIFPDLSLRHSSAIPALIPLCLTYYALAVLTILPNTFVFRLLLQPVFLWQVWGCVTKVDISAWLAHSVGLQNSDSTKLWNFPYMMGLFCLALRSFEWTFIVKEPLRKYELTTDQGAPTESKKPLSISSALLDGLDLFFNQRGLGMLASPVVSSTPSGGSTFDPNRSLIPRIALAAFAGICGGVWMHLLIDTLYHMAALVGRLVFRQPASYWPPLSDRPWVATSLHDFWSFRWQQLYRHIFSWGVPVRLIGAFTVSAVMHHIGLWGVGHGSEFSTTGGFFLMMGVGVAMEVGFKKVTDKRVGGFFGWLWTMLWVLVWGTRMIDGWARHGVLASEFFPPQLRPAKVPIEAVISLLNVMNS
ncbi:hypothetical protein H4582DRAFT_1972753 [Lactarius indigo]|nr:hypothetical protein H4582DRAFT_1972753 [Lactarius indigo]